MAELLPAIEIETAPNPDASVIWLHGLGDTGDGWSQVVPGLAHCRSRCACASCFRTRRRCAVAINNGYVMPAWYDIREANLSERADLAGVRRSQAQLEALIARENARGVDDARIVLAGFSQGGAVALYTGLRHPQRLAGIVALSTYLIERRRAGAEASRREPRRADLHGARHVRSRRAPRVGAGVARGARARRLERRVARVPDGALRR